MHRCIWILFPFPGCAWKKLACDPLHVHIAKTWPLAAIYHDQITKDVSR